MNGGEQPVGGLLAASKEKGVFLLHILPWEYEEMAKNPWRIYEDNLPF